MRSPQSAWTFFSRTKRAAASARALSLRLSSLSSLRSRFCSALRCLRPANAARAASSAMLRQRSRSASCTPSRRRKAPSSDASRRAASRRMRSSSSGDTSSGRRARAGRPPFCCSSLIVRRTVVASLSQRERVDSATPDFAASSAMPGPRGEGELEDHVFAEIRRVGLRHGSESIHTTLGCADDRALVAPNLGDISS
jgi:hypothetical protein